MRTYPIVWFYILAFGISWLGMIPAALGSYDIAPFNSSAFQFLTIFYATGPALAAVIVSQVTQGTTGIRALLKGLIQWRVGLVWYSVAVLGPLVLFIAARIITKVMGLVVTRAGFQGSLFPYVIFAFVISLSANTCEEIGWRGFALPRLQNRYNALRATLMVGLLWALWHLPLFFWAGQPMAEAPFALFISIVASAFIFTWLYNSTQGSILLVALFHFAGNLFGFVVSGVSPVAYALVNCAVAIVLLAVFGSANLARRERVSVG